MQTFFFACDLSYSRGPMVCGAPCRFPGWASRCPCVCSLPAGHACTCCCLNHVAGPWAPVVPLQQSTPLFPGPQQSGPSLTLLAYVGTFGDSVSELRRMDLLQHIGELRELYVHSLCQFRVMCERNNVWATRVASL